MPTPPAQLPSAFGPLPVVRRPAPRHRRFDHLVLTGLAVIATLGLAAWQVPPLLDWSGYKSLIATYASARLGRHVTIGGQVRLTVLPHATLMADDVSLADRGDGVSAKIGTLRLEVSLSGLLTGRVLPRALAMERPVVSLPWPLPRGTAPGMRPALHQEFTATMEEGTILLGGVAVRGLSASFRTEPDTGAFGAQGAARVAGLPWRFTALAGAPGGDGVSPLTVTLDGMADNAARPGAGMLGTGGAFRGRILPDGAIAGSLSLRGPDASRLCPAPAVPWQVSGDIRGDANTVVAPSADVTLDHSPGQAAVSFHLAAPALLKVTAHVGSLAGGDWVFPLLHQDAANRPMFATELDLSAGAMRVAGDTLRSVHLVMSRSGGAATLQSLSATLPGGALVDAGGKLAEGDTFAGHVHIVARDLRRALRLVAGGALDGLPSSALARADLAGALTVSGGHASLTFRAGHIDESLAGGTLSVGFGRRPTIGLDISVDRLSPAYWAPSPQASVSQALATAVQMFSGIDATMRVKIDHVALPGVLLRNAGLDVQAGREGLQLHGFTADLPGGHFGASATLGADGTLADGHLDLVAPDAALLPAAWRVPEKLWHGGFHLAVNAAGPPQDIAAQMRADLGDLRAEAEAHVDADASRMAATVTLRHPGAPRLLDSIGVSGAEAWLENGSLAVLAHVIVSPGHLQAEDFSVSAAQMQVGGGFDLDLTGAVPTIDGHADAGTLALPAFQIDGKSPLRWGLLQHIRADVRLTAAHVLSALWPVADNASARLLAAGGDVLIDDMRADVAGGHMTGQVALDSLRDPPMAAAHGTENSAVPDAAGPAKLTISGGTVDMDGDVVGQGYSPWALVASSTGTVEATVHDVTVNGLDLGAVRTLLVTAKPGLRAALQSALGRGETAGVDGSLAGTIVDGVLHLAAGRLIAAPGTMLLAGTIDGPRQMMDLAFSVVPAVTAPPVLRLRLAGPFQSPARQIDVLSAMAWAGQGRTSPVRPARPLHK